jgi:hypothetical protein
MTVDPKGNLWVAYNPASNYYAARERHNAKAGGRYVFSASTDGVAVAEYLAGTVTTAAGFASPPPQYDAILTTNFDFINGFAVDGSGNVFVGQDNQIEAFPAPASSAETPAAVANTFPGTYNTEALGISGGTIYALDVPSPAPSSTATTVVQPYTFTGGALVPGAPIVPAGFTSPTVFVGDYAGVITSETSAMLGGPPTLSVFLAPSTGVPVSSNLLAEQSGPYNSLARDPATGDVYFLSGDGTPAVVVYAPSGTNALASVAYFLLPSYAIAATVDANFLYVALYDGTISAYPKYNAAAPYDARFGRTFNPYRPFTKAAFAKIATR